MFKIRLHGLLPDSTKAAEQLETIYRVVDVSTPYKDRGNSELYRIYVTVTEKGG